MSRFFAYHFIESGRPICGARSINGGDWGTITCARCQAILAKRKKSDAGAKKCVYKSDGEP